MAIDLTLLDKYSSITDISKYSKLSLNNWNKLILIRGSHLKYYEQLLGLKENYPIWITEQLEIRRQYTDYEIACTPADRLIEIANKTNKLKRLVDKYACTLKEIDIRDRNLLPRTPVGTTYYIDLGAGSDLANGLGTGTAWKTLGQYTSVTQRTAGDIAYVRANTTQTLNNADLDFDESGTQATIISIIGCDATTNDPWNDDSNVYPILSFGDAAYRVSLDCDYWLIKRLSIQDSTKSGSGNFYLTGLGNQLSYCNITDNAGASAYGLCFAAIGKINYIDNCTFNDNKNRSITTLASSIIFINNCTFDGGGETTDYGIYIDFGTRVYVSDSTFGSTTAHDTQDIHCIDGVVYSRNCTFNKATLSVVTSFNGAIYSEDDDGTFGNQVSYYLTGTVTKSATARSGGASSSAQMLPSTNCGAIFPLCINNLSPLAPDFAIYNTSTSSVNVDIYIRADSAWGTYPTAAQLYTEASYLSNAASAARSTVVSDEVLSDGTTWVAFRTTFTPARAGWIYMKVYLKLYTATEGVLVDIAPVIS